MKKRCLLLLVVLFAAVISPGCISQKSDIAQNSTVLNNDTRKEENVSVITTEIQYPLGIFYYPWTGGNPEKSPGAKETWLHWKDGGHNPPKTWASSYIPDYGSSSDPYNGLYSSKDTNIIRQQLTLINKSGINFVISSWWGQNHYTDQALDIIFKQVLSTKDSPYGGKFCIYYEKEGFGDIPKSEIISDINYIKAKYANSPYYYKIDGRPVVFVYNTKSGLISETFEQEIQKWKEVRDETGIYTVLKVSGGYKNVESYADSWHEYAPASSFKKTGNYSAFVSPGFHKWSESPRMERENFERFENDIIALKNADVKFKLIETWNEWGEGTGIEPARKINHDDVNGFTVTEPSYGTKYVDVIAKYFAN